MARCGCSAGGCSCVMGPPGDNVTISGDGTADNPWIISVPDGGVGPTGATGVPGAVGPTGPTGVTGPTGATLGAQDKTFSYAGTLVSGTTSPPVRLRFSKTLVLLAVTLGVAGSTNTVLNLSKNGVLVATITVISGATVHDEVLSIAYAADTDKLALIVTTAGTGASDMTADARFD